MFLLYLFYRSFYNLSIQSKGVFCFDYLLKEKCCCCNFYNLFTLKGTKQNVQRKLMQSWNQEFLLLLQQQLAVLYYTSCWDFVGIKIEIVGMDPNCCHPKPRPSTPRNFLDSIHFQYQKQMWIHFKDICVGMTTQTVINHCKK